MAKKRFFEEEGGLLPKALSSVDAFYELVEVLLEADRTRRSISRSRFGPVVVTEDRAGELLNRVAAVTAALLGGNPVPGSKPALILRHDRQRLPFLFLRLYGFLLPLCLFFFYLTLGHPGEDPAVWFVRAVLLFLLIFPMIYRRRLRLNLEHRCCYRHDGGEKSFIYMEELEEAPFQSYLAHEHAHHVYRELYGEQGFRWFREGWCRMIQWKVCERLAMEEKDPAFLHHVLLQVTGEIKFALTIMGHALRLRLPRRAKKVKTIFRINSLVSFFTGNPGYDVKSLLTHALGTAFFALAQRRISFDEMILQLPRRASPEKISFPPPGSAVP